MNNAEQSTREAIEAMLDTPKNIVEQAFYAMDLALRDPSVVPLEFNQQGYKTGLSASLADLERLFSLMAKAAHLFRQHDGPAPAHWSNTWNRTAARCAAVCREAREQYTMLCVQSSPNLGHEWRQRDADWHYLVALFSSWPDRCGAIGPDEPTSIAKAAGIGPVEVASGSVENTEGAKVADSLYHLKTAYNRQQLARIFDRLVAAGYIDGSAPEALADFLNAFDPAAEKQGRISWIWADKRNKDGNVSPRHIVDFVAQMTVGIPHAITPEMRKKVIPAVFGLEIKSDILSKYLLIWEKKKYCDTHDDISAILSGA